MKHLSKIFMIVLITILGVNFTCDAKTQRQNSPTRVQQHFSPNDASSIFTVYKVDIRDVIVSYLGNVDGFLTILFSAAQ